MLKYMHIPMAAALLLTPVTVVAQPVVWTENGHVYELIDDFQISWTDAKAAAEALICNGTPGHLVTVTSIDENAFLVGSFGLGPRHDMGHHWFGGFQPEGSDEPAGGWSWVTGEVWEYENWGELQPNDGGGNEDYTFFHGCSCQVGAWQDAANDHGKAGGYIVEYSFPPTCPADFDGDGMVGPFDLAQLLGAWGPCEEPILRGSSCSLSLLGVC